MPGEDIYAWSTTAADNGSADSAINWAEGQTRASVNNSSRSELAAHAKNRNLQNGSITTGGTGDAQTFTSGVGYTAVPTNMRVLLKIGNTNTTTCTLEMDGIGPVEIKRNITGFPSLVAGDLIASSYAEFVYNGTNWLLLATVTEAELAGKVSKSGDTMTGLLTVNGGLLCSTNITTATMNTTGDINAGGNIGIAGGLGVSGNMTASGLMTATGGLICPTNIDTQGLVVHTAADLSGGIFTSNIVASVGGQKPGGGPWDVLSDRRIKTVVGNYTNGLSEVTALNPVRYTYKGNDALTETGPSPHQQVIGKEFVGLVAQDVQAHLPEMVITQAGYIDGSAVPDLHGLDTTALIYALINSVKELKQRLETLEASR